MKITVVGMGYVGLSNAIMLATKYSISVLDVDEGKVELLNKRISPLEDSLVNEYLKKDTLQISATQDKHEAYDKTNFVIICVPTDFDKKKLTFNTSIIDKIVLHLHEINFLGLIVIRSTVPIGYTESLHKIYPHLNFSFFPEFLREGTALWDSLHPTRIISGSNCKLSKKFSEILINCSLKKDIPLLSMSSSEAESVKLFANSYLAMRVAFFNELDTFALTKNLDTKIIIEGIGMDHRIGNHYNNPSFGYGGYCLPKDVSQLQNSLTGLPKKIIASIDKSNQDRKKFLARIILDKKAKKIGIYRLNMKKNSDNNKGSAILDILMILKSENIDMHIFEPSIKEKSFMDIPLETNLNYFKESCDLIVANRVDKYIESCVGKVFTRDLFKSD